MAKRPSVSALAGFETWVLLVDDVNPAFTTNQLVVTVASFERFKRISDLHCSDPRVIQAMRPAIQSKTRQPRARSSVGRDLAAWAFAVNYGAAFYRPYRAQ